MRRFISADTETECFRAGVMAGELACTTWAEGSSHGIVHQSESRAWVQTKLDDPDAVLVGQFMAYDTAAWCAAFKDLSFVQKVFKAYDEDRITDVKIRAQLIDIGKGQFRGKHSADGTWNKIGYALDDHARRYLGLHLQKDGWRRRYGSFIDVPLSQWPAKAKEIQGQAAVELAEFDAAGGSDKNLSKEQKQWIKDLRAIVADPPTQVLKYAIDDAIVTLGVCNAQEREHPALLVDQFNQARYSFSQHLISTWGIRTRAEGVAALRLKTMGDIKEAQERLEAAGLVVDGKRKLQPTKDHMVMVCKRDGLRIRLTKETKVSKGGGISLDEEACLATGDPLLADYAKFSGLGRVISTDIKMLEAGTVHPVHTRFDLAETTRTTSSKPNLMNPSRKGGIRDCFVPRAGKVFVQADYPQLELYTWAQVCMTRFGHSEMAKALNAGVDPHLALAADIAGISYLEAQVRYDAGDEEIKNLRNLAKVANFGIIGGLGAARLVEYAWSTFHVRITEERAKDLKGQHARRWPEVEPFFGRVRKLVSNPEKLATTVALGSGRIRSGCKYTEACNDDFQTLGAVCAKRAGWLLARAEYAEPESVLFGSRTVLFLHDEYFVETDDNYRAHDVAFALAETMSKGANEFLPDVPIPASRIEPTLMRFWAKDAKQVFVDGRLVPWEGKAAA